MPEESSGTETGLITGSKMYWGFPCAILTFYMVFFLLLLWLKKKNHCYVMVFLEGKLVSYRGERPLKARLTRNLVIIFWFSV